MGNTGGVEPKPILTVNIERGTEARGPAGERKQSLGILGGRCRRGEKMQADGARVGKAEAGVEPYPKACCIDGGEHEAAFLAADERKRPVIRNGLIRYGPVFAGGSLPFEAFDGKKR